MTNDHRLSDSPGIQVSQYLLFAILVLSPACSCSNLYCSFYFSTLVEVILMYDIISEIIHHAWVTTNAGEQQYIYFVCSALIILLTVVFVDLIYRTFSHFWRA